MHCDGPAGPDFGVLGKILELDSSPVATWNPTGLAAHALLDLAWIFPLVQAGLLAGRFGWRTIY